MTNQEYQVNELKRFDRDMARPEGFFGGPKEFRDDLVKSGRDWLLEQADWIINGTYGADRCLAMQRGIKRLTPRMNRRAVIGQVFLSMLYGKTWSNNGWASFPEYLKISCNLAADRLMACGENEWAIKLEV